MLALSLSAGGAGAASINVAISVTYAENTWAAAWWRRSTARP